MHAWTPVGKWGGGGACFALENSFTGVDSKAISDVLNFIYMYVESSLV